MDLYCGNTNRNSEISDNVTLKPNEQALSVFSKLRLEWRVSGYFYVDIVIFMQLYCIEKMNLHLTFI